MAGTIATSARAYIDDERRLLERMDCAAIDAYAVRLFEAWRDDRAVYVFGNGGSSSCASHHVADYVKTAQVDGQRRLRAFSLSDNKEMLTAIGNDLSYEEIFVHPLESYAKRGDVAVAISCSGNSPNVVRASLWAREAGLEVVAITGFSGGKIGGLADIHINVPSENYGIIEDVQLAIGHMVSQMLHVMVRSTVTASGASARVCKT
jgi:D-sedoheptulose 7-phosphate isomerase